VLLKNPLEEKRDKGLKHRFWSRERYFQVLALILVLAFSALLFSQRDKVVELGGYGYAGAFVISALTSASIIIPVPGFVVIATLGAILDPLWVGVVSGLGATLGEMTGYLLGYGGRLGVEQSRLYARMVGWMGKWGGLTIFFLALIPNPAFDVAGATAGLSRYPVWKFVLFAAAGEIPKHIFFAHSGAWGIKYLPFL